MNDLSYCLEIYSITVEDDECKFLEDLSPLEICDNGLVKLNGTEIRSSYDDDNDQLTIEEQEFGKLSLSGIITFTDSGDEKTFSGKIFPSQDQENWPSNAGIGPVIIHGKTYENEQPKTIQEFKVQIKYWYEHDPVFAYQFHEAINNVTPIPEGTDPDIIYDWRDKTIYDLCNFFDDWYKWEPDVSTGLQYIRRFAWLYYENRDGLKFVTTGLGYLMTKHFVVLNGKKMDEPNPELVEKWVKELGGYEKINQYYDFPKDEKNSFNDFFTRELKDPRPISTIKTISCEDDDSVVVSPADAIVNMIDDNLSIDNTKLQVKTQRLNVRELLNNSEYAEHFEGGTAVSCILMPDVYHHYHAPVSGDVVESHEDVAGNYFGIDEFPKLINGGNVGYGYDYSVFEHFRRGYLIIETEKYGYVAMIPVGLNTIASVIFEPDFQEIPNKKPVKHIDKGHKIGHFQYGGSMNILLFEKGCFPSIRIPQGQIIGTLKEKERTDPSFSF
jgi:phosphatidylserine decarboxylase